MPKFTTDSKFLSHNDISDVEDTVVTIKGVDRESVGQGAQAKEKWILYFRELKKGLALNKTNGETLGSMLQTFEMDEWIGKKIALYVKDDVEYQGKLVCAVRVRPRVPGSAKKAEPQPEPFSIDAWITDLNLAKSPAECFALKRKLIYAPINDEEATQLNEMADARMVELKQGA